MLWCVDFELRVLKANLEGPRMFGHFNTEVVNPILVFHDIILEFLWVSAWFSNVFEFAFQLVHMVEALLNK